MEQSSNEPNAATLIFPKGVEAGMIETFMQMLERVIPLLGNIKGSLKECAQKIPTASNGLDGAFQVTEDAVVKILNTLENLRKRFDTANAILLKIKSANDYQMNLIGQISLRLKAAGDKGGVNPEVSTLATLLDRFLQISNSSGAYTTLSKYLEDSQADLSNISVALQFQDISSQQIDSANKLITAVHEDLVLILKYFEMKKQHNETAGPHNESVVNRNPADKKGEQELADKMVVEWNNTQLQH